MVTARAISGRRLEDETSSLLPAVLDDSVVERAVDGMQRMIAGDQFGPIGLDDRQHAVVLTTYDWKHNTTFPLALS
jgi:hypothetical protein